MLKLIDRLRIRGVRGDLTRDEELKKLSKTIEKIKTQNTALLQDSLQDSCKEFSKLRQKNKQQLSFCRIEFSKQRAKLKDEYRHLISSNRRNLENLKMQLRRNITYCY
ncbi:MAG: hypothetical protein QXI52_02815 [Nitrososphaerota archaeon]